MRMWVPQIPEFQYAIWNKLRHGATVEEIVYNEGVRGGVSSFNFFCYKQTRLEQQWVKPVTAAHTATTGRVEKK